MFCQKSHVLREWRDMKRRARFNLKIRMKKVSVQIGIIFSDIALNDNYRIVHGRVHI